MTEDVYQSRAKLATRLAFVAAGFGVACWAPLVPFAKTRCHLGDAIVGLAGKTRYHDLAPSNPEASRCAE
jgi:hypothetical protein